MQRRLFGIDIIRCVCSILVIFIHIGLGNFDYIFDSVARVAVPFFAIVTGYFYKNTCASHKEQKHILFYLVKTLEFNLIYIVWEIFQQLLQNRFNPIEYLSSIINMNTIKQFLLFNVSPVRSHLWYLGAMMYTLMVIYFFNKKNKIKYLYYLIPILLILSCLLGRYSWILNIKIHTYITRSWLFGILPYVCIGMLVNEYQDKIYKIKLYWIMITCAIFTILACLECSNIYSNNGDYYISTPFLAVSIFIFALKWSEYKSNTITTAIANIGRKYTLYIYIFHEFWLDIFGPIFVYSDSGLHNILMSIFIFSWTLLVSWIIEMLIEMMKRKRCIM